MAEATLARFLLSNYAAVGTVFRGIQGEEEKMTRAHLRRRSNRRLTALGLAVSTALILSAIGITRFEAPEDNAAPVRSEVVEEPVKHLQHAKSRTAPRIDPRRGHRQDSLTL